jgi:hypothetical protein
MGEMPAADGLPDILEAREEVAVELLVVVGGGLVPQLAIDREGIVEVALAEGVEFQHRVFLAPTSAARLPDRRGTVRIL